MLSTLSHYADLFTSFEVLLQETRSDLSKIKIKLGLIDGSLLFLGEVNIKDVLFDYSYHWQTREGTLIIRWDNAAHYPGIATHPHHKHIENENHVESSYEQNLQQVLEFVRTRLLTT